jgi:hypothetical protein
MELVLTPFGTSHTPARLQIEQHLLENLRAPVNECIQSITRPWPAPGYESPVGVRKIFMFPNTLRQPDKNDQPWKLEDYFAACCALVLKNKGEQYLRSLLQEHCKYQNFAFKTDALVDALLGSSSQTVLESRPRPVITSAASSTNTNSTHEDIQGRAETDKAAAVSGVAAVSVHAASNVTGVWSSIAPTTTGETSEMKRISPKHATPKHASPEPTSEAHIGAAVVPPVISNFNPPSHNEMFTPQLQQKSTPTSFPVVEHRLLDYKTNAMSSQVANPPSQRLRSSMSPPLIASPRIDAEMLSTHFSPSVVQHNGYRSSPSVHALSPRALSPRTQSPRTAFRAPSQYTTYVEGARESRGSSRCSSADLFHRLSEERRSRRSVHGTMRSQVPREFYSSHRLAREQKTYCSDGDSVRHSPSGMEDRKGGRRYMSGSRGNTPNGKHQTPRATAYGSLSPQEGQQRAKAFVRRLQESNAELPEIPMLDISALLEQHKDWSASDSDFIAAQEEFSRNQLRRALEQPPFSLSTESLSPLTLNQLKVLWEAALCNNHMVQARNSGMEYVKAATTMIEQAAPMLSGLTERIQSDFYHRKYMWHEINALTHGRIDNRDTPFRSALWGLGFGILSVLAINFGQSLNLNNADKASTAPLSTGTSAPAANANSPPKRSDISQHSRSSQGAEYDLLGESPNQRHEFPNVYNRGEPLQQVTGWTTDCDDDDNDSEMETPSVQVSPQKNVLALEFNQENPSALPLEDEIPFQPLEPTPVVEQITESNEEL